MSARGKSWEKTAVKLWRQLLTFWCWEEEGCTTLSRLKWKNVMHYWKCPNCPKGETPSQWLHCMASPFTAHHFLLYKYKIPFQSTHISLSPQGTGGRQCGAGQGTLCTHSKSDILNAERVFSGLRVCIWIYGRDQPLSLYPQNLVWPVRNILFKYSQYLTPKYCGHPLHRKHVRFSNDIWWCWLCSAVVWRHY